MLKQINIVKEIDKVIDFVKEALLNEADEDKIFELSVLRYALVKHKKEKSHKPKIHFEYGDDVEFIHYLLSKNNIELLEKLGWTVLSRYQVVYTGRLECEEFLLVPPGEELPELLDVDNVKEEDYEIYFEKWRVAET